MLLDMSDRDGVVSSVESGLMLKLVLWLSSPIRKLFSNASKKPSAPLVHVDSSSMMVNSPVITGEGHTVIQNNAGHTFNHHVGDVRNYINFPSITSRPVSKLTPSEIVEALDAQTSFDRISMRHRWDGEVVSWKVEFTQLYPFRLSQDHPNGYMVSFRYRVNQEDQFSHTIPVRAFFKQDGFPLSLKNARTGAKFWVTGKIQEVYGGDSVTLEDNPALDDATSRDEPRAHFSE